MYIKQLIENLVKLPYETEWLEFKENNAKPEEIGEYISALANSAALHNQSKAYLIYGISDKTHDLVGTKFKFKETRTGIFNS